VLFAADAAAAAFFPNTIDDRQSDDDDDNDNDNMFKKKWSTIMTVGAVALAAVHLLTTSTSTTSSTMLTTATAFQITSSLPSPRRYLNRRRRILTQQRSARTSSALWSSNNNIAGDDDTDNDNFYYDDFAGQQIGGGSEDSVIDDADPLVSPSSSSSSSSTSSFLQQRFQLLQQNEESQLTELNENWKQGYWGVRGCSLDPFDVPTSIKNAASSNSRQNQNKKTIITCITKMPTSHDHDDVDHDDDMIVLVVGRSDGSLIWLRVDTTMPTNLDSAVTYFASRPVARSTDDGGMIIGSELADSSSLGEGNGSTGSDEDEEGIDSNSNSSPFSILAQLPPLLLDFGPIAKTAVLPKSKYLWALTGAALNPTQQIVSYTLSPSSAVDDDDVLLPTIPPDNNIPTFEIVDTPHTTPIIAMIPINFRNRNEFVDAVVTISSDGRIVLWSVGLLSPTIICQANLFEDDESGDMLSAEERIDSYNDVIICADAIHSDAGDDDSDSVLLLGSQMGKIYVLSISTSDAPNISFTSSWMAFTSTSQNGVSAIRLATSNTNNNNYVVVAGNLQGEIKQWELIASTSTSTSSSTGTSGRSTTAIKYQHWPRMTSQRLPNKAHVFQTSTSGDASAVPVRSILYLKQQQVVLTTTNEDLTVWDPVTGKILYQMNGLEFGSGFTIGTGTVTSTTVDIEPSLIVGTSSMLITNGMDQYVCIHDFAMERIDEDNVQDFLDVSE
jgi:hypothetical protein